MKVASSDLNEVVNGWVSTSGEDFFSTSDNYQIVLLVQAGYLEASEERYGSTVPYRLRVTNSGHDYLDAIRDNGIWKQTKDLVSETGGNATLEIIKSLAIGLVKKKIKQHTDVDL